MNLDHIRDRLQGVRGSSSRFMARCPAHDDRDPSLSVEDKGDKIVLHCHAGCATEDVLSAIGLSWADTFAERLEPIRPGRPLRVSQRRYLAKAFEIEFGIVQFAEIEGYTNAEDEARTRLAEERLAVLAEGYGIEEFEQIAQEWESRDYVSR